VHLDRCHRDRKGRLLVLLIHHDFDALDFSLAEPFRPKGQSKFERHVETKQIVGAELFSGKIVYRALALSPIASRER
jgi:hypothetical protein